MAHLTRAEVLASGEVDPEYRKAFESRPTNIEGTTIPEIRLNRTAHLEALRPLYPIPGPIPTLVKEYDDSFAARDGAIIPVRVYQPIKENGVDAESSSPLVVMYHEGGWILGDRSDEDLNCRMFARDLGCVCVNVEYRLAPEHKFPTGVNDCWDALKWAVKNATLLKANPEQGLIVGGSSAGGNLASIMALLSRDTNLQPPVTGQYLSVPALLPETSVPPSLKHHYQSRTTSTSDPVLKMLQPGGLDAILAPDPNTHLWDPFNHPAGHAGVAKAFFQVCGIDPLRDEAVLYDAALRRSGAMTRFNLYEGYGHMFWTNYPEMERSKEYVKDTVKGVRWLLEKAPAVQ